MADNETNTVREAYTTHDPDRRRRNHRIPFLVAGAVAGLVVGVGTLLPVWWVPYRPAGDPRSHAWDGREGYHLRDGSLWEGVAQAETFFPSYRMSWQFDNGIVALSLLTTAAVAGLVSFWVARRLMNRSRSRPGATPATHPCLSP